MAGELNERIHRAAAALRSAGAKDVFLFGSAAEDRLDDASDIDLAVTGLPPERFFRAMGEARTILGRPLDLIDLDEPNPLVRYLSENGRLRRVA